MPISDSAGEDQNADVTRRTWLAAERTWLAWWRTALGAAAAAIGVGRLVPSLTHGSSWPFAALGVGYALLAIVVLIGGLMRQRTTERALRSGEFTSLPEPLVVGLTAGAIVLAVGTLIVVATNF
jgi:putative membrane protein